MTANAVNGILQCEGSWHNNEVCQPMQILVLNLMPNKAATERQFLTLLNDLNQDVEVSFMYPATHHFKSVSKSTLAQVYYQLADLKDRHFDGLIVTGAPVETLPFNEVDYWNEFTQIQDWAKTHVEETINECWASQAALYHDFGINKVNLKQKLFGIFKAHQLTHSQLTNQLETFYNPQSRNSVSLVDRHHLPADLEIIADQLQTGPMILRSANQHQVYLTGHPEYDLTTLDDEYHRDCQRGLSIVKPVNYYYNHKIIDTWSKSSHQLYQNWLNLIFLENKLPTRSANYYDQTPITL